jgi:hypothetical protein
VLGEHFTLPWCSSLRTTPAHQPPTQFSVVLVAAATGDLLDRVQQIGAALDGSTQWARTSGG